MSVAVPRSLEPPDFPVVSRDCAQPVDAARGLGGIVLRRAAPFALAFGLFLAIWGVKLAVIDRFGSDLPYWDQWAKEGDLLLTPWFENQALWRNLLLPHNEHRIAPTLALNLALVVGGGQWDARVQCIAGAALHAAIAAGLLLWALRYLSRGWAIAAGGALLLSTAAPIVWENLLGGFQSQFSFLTGFSLLALHGLLAAPALTWRWWVGFGSGLLALVSMGSGVLVVAPLLAVIALRGSDGRSARRDLVITLGAGLVLGGIGASLHVSAPWHDSLRAASPGVFLEYWVRTLAWPRPGSPWLALLIWLPWLVLAVDRGCRRRTVSKATAETGPADFILAAGGWVLLQMAAVAFSRAGAGGYPANRYGDIAALGLPVSFLALALLAARLRPALACALGGVWLLLAGTGVGIAAQESLAGPLPAKLAESRAFERHVQAFVATDDYAAFALQALPFPSPEWLARILRRADIRAILPASVRAPVPLAGFALDPTPPATLLAHRRTKMVAIAGEWRSAPVPPGDGWWKIETSGPAFTPPRGPGSARAAEPAALRYLASADGVARRERATTVAASRPPMADTWRAAYVRAGRTSGHLIAHVVPAGGWLALSEPIAVSTLSHRARQGAKLGLWFGGAGAVLYLSVAAGMIGSARRRRPRSDGGER